MSLEKDAKANQQALLGNDTATNTTAQSQPQQVQGIVRNTSQTQAQFSTQSKGQTQASTGRGGKLQTVVGVFSSHQQAESAISQLRSQGFTDEEISVVAKQGTDQGYDTGNYDPFSFTEMANEGVPPLEVKRVHHGNSVANGVFTGGTIGGLGGLLAAAGAIAVPGIGPVLAMGPIAAALGGLVAGGVVGGLIDLGVPAEPGQRYESQVQQGSVLAVLRSSNNKVGQAAQILRQNGAQEVETY